MNDRAEALRRALIEIDREISFGSYIEYIQQIARKALDADQGKPTSQHPRSHLGGGK